MDDKLEVLICNYSLAHESEDDFETTRIVEEIKKIFPISAIILILKK